MDTINACGIEFGRGIHHCGPRCGHYDRSTIPSECHSDATDILAHRVKCWAMIPILCLTFSRSGSLLPIPGILLSQNPIDAGPPDPQPDGDFRGPDALCFEADDLSGLSPRSRHPTIRCGFSVERLAAAARAG